MKKFKKKKKERRNQKKKVRLWKKESFQGLEWKNSHEKILKKQSFRPKPYSHNTGNSMEINLRNNIDHFKKIMIYQIPLQWGRKFE